MNNTKFYILLLLIVGFGGYTVYKLNQQPKVAVVDFQELVIGYDGMQEAVHNFEEKAVVWETEADSLQLLLNSMVADLENNQYNLEILRQKEGQMVMMNNYVIQRQNELAQQAQEEDNKLTVAVVNQVMEFIDTYSVENGYDIIYGKNEGNYILHKSDEFDITEEVLNELNIEYQGG